MLISLLGLDFHVLIVFNHFLLALDILLMLFKEFFYLITGMTLKIFLSDFGTDSAIAKTLGHEGSITELLIKLW